MTPMLGTFLFHLLLWLLGVVAVGGATTVCPIVVESHCPDPIRVELYWNPALTAAALTATLRKSSSRVLSISRFFILFRRHCAIFCC